MKSSYIPGAQGAEGHDKKRTTEVKRRDRVALQSKSHTSAFQAQLVGIWLVLQSFPIVP